MNGSAHVLHGLRLVSLGLLEHGLGLLAVPLHGLRDLHVLPDAVHLLLHEVELVVLVQLLHARLVEVLARLDQILLQRDLLRAEIAVHSTDEPARFARLLEMLVELLLRGGEVAGAQIDHHDREIALEAGGEAEANRETCCAPAAAW